MVSSFLLPFTLCFFSVIESTAFKLPRAQSTSGELLNQVDGVDDHSIAKYGFSLIRNTTVPCVKTDQMRFRFHPLSDNDKLAILSTGGGSYIREFMAKDMEEAEKNFLNLFGMISKSKNKQSSRVKELKTKRDVLHFLQNQAKINPKHSAEASHPSQNTESGEQAVRENANGKTKAVKERSSKKDNIEDRRHVPYVLPSEMGIHSFHTDEQTGERLTYDYCQNRGQRTSDGYYLYMCTTCASTTSLGEEYWPPIVNEAVRHDEDPYCFIADGIPQGECMQKIMPMNMLRRKPGYCSLALKDGEIVIVDEWAPYTRELKIGCECVMDATSNFAQYVGKYN